jgi:hypothetical protein
MSWDDSPERVDGAAGVQWPAVRRRRRSRPAEVRRLFERRRRGGDRQAVATALIRSARSGEALWRVGGRERGRMRSGGGGAAAGAADATVARLRPAVDRPSQVGSVASAGAVGSGRFD